MFPLKRPPPSSLPTRCSANGFFLGLEGPRFLFPPCSSSTYQDTIPYNGTDPLKNDSDIVSLFVISDDLFLSARTSFSYPGDAFWHFRLPPSFFAFFPKFFGTISPVRPPLPLRHFQSPPHKLMSDDFCVAAHHWSLTTLPHYDCALSDVCLLLTLRRVHFFFPFIPPPLPSFQS